MSDLYINAMWYVRLYRDAAYDFWEHLTPMGYGSILIGVALFGWILMRGTLRR